jgi:hypothetical protein
MGYIDLVLSIIAFVGSLFMLYGISKQGDEWVLLLIIPVLIFFIIIRIFLEILGVI